MLGRDQVGTGKVGLVQDALERDLNQEGQEEEQTAELGPALPGLQIELADVGDFGNEGALLRRSLVIAAAGQACEAFFLHDQGDGDGTEGDVFAAEGTADVIDGEMLFAEGDDSLPRLLALGRGAWAFGGGRKKARSGSCRKRWTRTRKLPGE